MTAPTTQGGADGVRIAGELFARRRLILRTVAVALVGVLAYGLLAPRSWTARGSFVAQSGSLEGLGNLAGLASQFGVNLGAAESGYPPRFYAALVTSDEVLGAIVELDDPSAPTGSPQTVGRALGARADDPSVLRARAIERARRDVVGTLYDQRTGLTEFTVRTGDPHLSAFIARAIVEEVNRFNVERHRSRASTEREFVESRRNAIAAEVAEAEEAVRNFNIRNRSISDSPNRQLELQRLERRVEVLSSVLSSLNQSYEQARIEEARDTPVLTLVEPPREPALPDRRPLAQWAVGTIVLALLVSVGTLVALLLLGLIPSATPRAADTPATMLRTLVGEISRPWRLLR